MQGAADTPELWPLTGVRVVDFSSGISGPYATKILVDAGADVYKIEPPEGDPLRRWTAAAAPLPESEDGALFQFLNASKKSVVATLEGGDEADAAGFELVSELCRRADLIVTDRSADEMAELGLALETLQRDNPALSLVTITPWGGTGPWKDRPSTEFTLQASTGSSAYRGRRDRKPVAAGGRFGEWVGGTYAALGAASAWMSGRKTGKGQLVDVSLFECMLLSMTVYHDLNGQWAGGDLARSIEIPSIEPAKDGWVGFCTITGQQWKDFCALIGQPDIANDDSYLDGRRRMDHLEFIKGAIHAWTRERTVDEIIELASLMRIPVAPVGNGRTVLEMEQFVERGVFEKSVHGFTQPRVPYQLERTPVRPFGPAPSLGEHTEATRAEIAAGSRQSVQTRGNEEPESADPFPLTGLRIVDLSAFWAGPITTCYLADMGADVIKVESIQRPDGMRFAGAMQRESLWEWSPVFAGANPGKRDVTLQLDSTEGMALLKRLIAEADVVIENYSVRVLENFGLGWEQVHALSPRVIMVRMPAFGLDGPWRDRTGFAMTIEQVSGLAWLTGYADLPLVIRGACDPVGGMQTAFALLMALEHRRRTGEGQLVEVPLVENAMNLAAEQVVTYTAYGEVLERNENKGPSAAPQGLYRCAAEDRYVAIGISTDAEWERLRESMGDPAWARDDALSVAAGRHEHHDAIDAGIEEWLADQQPEAAAERLVEAGVPASAAINAHHVMPNPQLEHRAFFQKMVHPVTGEARYPGFPMRFSALGESLHRSPPPTLGQHNVEILRDEFGLSDEEISALEEAKVIGQRPSFM